MRSKIKFYRRKLIIPVNNGEIALYYSDLMYARYEEPYCWLHFSDGAKYKVEISVAELLKNLPEKPFFQCNRTDIVNLCYYGGYEEEPSMVALEDGTKFCLSIRRISDFKKKKAKLKRISPPCHPSLGSKNESCPDFGMFCSDETKRNKNDRHSTLKTTTLVICFYAQPQKQLRSTPKTTTLNIFCLKF